MTAAHSILPPSSAARRRQCSASTLAEMRYPQTEDSPASAEGTAAHWGLAELLQGNLIDVGLIAPNGVYLTQEMIEGAQLCYDDIAQELEPYNVTPRAGQIETPLRIARVHPESWGTPDYRIWLQGVRAKHLMLWDYKFGYRPVEVFENEQLIEYVAGSLDEMRIDGSNDQETFVTVKIVQPRAHHRDGPVRAWAFRASDIRGHINRQSHAAHEALGPSPTFRVGAECRDCRARHACETLQRAALSACDEAGKAQPFDLAPAAAALEYRVLKRHAALLDARISGLEEQLMAFGRAGKPTPGLRIEHGMGRERWTVSNEQVIAIGAALGVDIAKPREPMTPKQAVKAGLPAAVLPGIVNTPRGEAKLVEDDGSLARRVFG